MTKTKKERMKRLQELANRISKKPLKNNSYNFLNPSLPPEDWESPEPIDYYKSSFLKIIEDSTISRKNKDKFFSEINLNNEELEKFNQIFSVYKYRFQIKEFNSESILYILKEVNVFQQENYNNKKNEVIRQTQKLENEENNYHCFLKEFEIIKKTYPNFGKIMKACNYQNEHLNKKIIGIKSGISLSEHMMNSAKKNIEIYESIINKILNFHEKKIKESIPIKEHNLVKRERNKI